MKLCLDSLRALLAGSVDYAGLFPPAGLALQPALDNHASYLRGDDSWMLGHFVLPTANLREAMPMLTGRFDDHHLLRISALGSKGNSTDTFLTNLRTSLQELADIPRAHRGTLAIEQFEAPLPPQLGSISEMGNLLWKAAELIGSLFPGHVRIFWEVPFSNELPATLRRVSDHNAQLPPTALGSAMPRFQPDGRLIHYSPSASRVHCQPFGVKLRTGGMDAAAFPTCEQLAIALVVARDSGVALKFTAGLHHPLRHYDARLGTRMHGFLNVYAAGILGREHRLGVKEIEKILEDESPESFRFDAEGFAWRDRQIPTAALAVHREFITSFGSCSFDEPRDDLRALGLM